MRSKQIVKIAVDIAMTAVLLLLMTYELIGQVSHELLGIIMFVLFILHHILNSRWIKNLIRGEYTALRTLQTVLVSPPFTENDYLFKPLIHSSTSSKVTSLTFECVTLYPSGSTVASDCML